jgi:thioredoxin-related protein
MIKIALLALLMFTSVYGEGIKWQKDYATALQSAKKLHKPMMFIISSHTCHYCVQLENTTLKDSKVIQKLNAEYIPAIVYVDEDPIFPRNLYVGGTPATWFISSNGEPMFEPLMGAIGNVDFLKALDIVSQEYKKSSVKK